MSALARVGKPGKTDTRIIKRPPSTISLGHLIALRSAFEVTPVPLHPAGPVLCRLLLMAARRWSRL
jgi:hypothetical protein